jgi:K(+)-stimulated pyrophosphate-energized sodium pump
MPAGVALNLSVDNPVVLIGLIIGGALPFLFSAFCMQAVGKAAFDIVSEVRRQFKEIPGIMEGTGKPEYGKCVDIVTSAALKQMAPASWPSWHRWSSGSGPKPPRISSVIAGVLSPYHGVGRRCTTTPEVHQSGNYGGKKSVLTRP